MKFSKKLKPNRKNNMPANKKALSLISAAIKKHSTFFIAGHLKPDGDTVGSALALGSLLHRLGKKPKLFSKEPIPEYLRFLPSIHSITITPIVTGTFDCAIILESSTLDRMGNLIDSTQAKTFINIDHHSTSTNFGHINYLDPGASSSAEQIFYLFKHMKLPISRAEAQNLYIGLVTDTGKFQHINTSPDAMLMAANLIEAGVKPFEIYDKIYATKSLVSLKLLSLALSTLNVTKEGDIAYIEVTQDMYRASGASAMDTEDIINYSMMMPGIKIGMLFREIENSKNEVKVSFRSRGQNDVNQLARLFGGGGHKNAAGCTIKGTITSAKKQVIPCAVKLLLTGLAVRQ